MSGFQPSAEGVALFSQRFASLHIGLNYYALSGLLQLSAISQQLNASTTQQLNTPKGLARMGTRAESPVYFSPIPQGWGIDSHTPL